MSTRIIVGNALEVLPTLQANSIHCSVSSPPYYNLRKYSGNQDCWWPDMEYVPMPGLLPISVPQWYGSLGTEPELTMYIGHLVAIYRQVYRVLREDSVCFIVIGDSYCSQGGFRDYGSHDGGTGRKFNSGLRPSGAGLKQGDLMLVPHRLALALQADGWVVRNDLVYSKKAAMPESVKGWSWSKHRIRAPEWKAKRYIGKGTEQDSQSASERIKMNMASARAEGINHEAGAVSVGWVDCPGCPKCEPDGYVLKRGSWRHTRSHEFVIMAVKKMQYFADQEKVREASTGQAGAAVNFRRKTKDHLIPNQAAIQHRLDRPDTVDNPAGRNPRSVLSPSPEPSGLKHFAIFPTGLIEPLIKATCPTRCCPKCGKGWSPVIKRGEPRARPDNPNPALPYHAESGHTNATGATTLHKMVESNILGYRPSCGCGHGLLPDDLETISSPTGHRVTKDPSLETGRAGFNRLRGPNEGSRPITRYEQRKYAEQLKNSPHRNEMETEAGSAFAHYIRTDKSGARPAPSHLLEKWIKLGWLERVHVPRGKALEPVPGVVLDPFIGSGTTALVADRLGLDCIGIDVSETYAEMSKERIEGDAPLLAKVEIVK